MSERSRLATAVLFGLCCLWLFLTLFPLYWTLVTSLKTPPAVNRGPTYIPFVDFDPTIQPYVDALTGQRGDFYKPFINSTMVGLSATFLSVLLGAMAAYALVRFQFRVRLGAGIAFTAIGIGGFLALTAWGGWSEVYALGLSLIVALTVSIWLNGKKLPGPILGNTDVVFWFLSQRMFPPIVTAFALYLLYSELGREGLRALDTYGGLVMCYTAFSLPIVVWLMRDFFQALPVEIEEAALVDNVPRLRIFFQIVVPMALPGLGATALITLGFVWNEFLFALLLTTSEWQTLPIFLSGQNSYRGDEWWAISVAAIIAIAPMMAMAFILARLLRGGLTLGGIR
ncbi:MAG: carbohydrate ABC transporter permease [Azospirillaceae bacterium]